MSFQMHGLQIYSGGYGMAFANDLMSFAVYMNGTAYGPPPSIFNLLQQFLLDGTFQMMHYGTGQGQFSPAMWDISVIGREIARTYGDDWQVRACVCVCVIVVYIKALLESACVLVGARWSAFGMLLLNSFGGFF